MLSSLFLERERKRETVSVVAVDCFEATALIACECLPVFCPHWEPDVLLPTPGETDLSDFR
jgi:hypothetical protein